MSPRRVLAEHSSVELTEWRAFFRAFGFSYDTDVAAGVIAAEVRNTSGGMPTGSGPNAPTRVARPSDYFPHLINDDDGSHEATPTSHDDVVEDYDVVEADDEPVASGVDRAFENRVAMWVISHNAKVQANEQLEEQLSASEPPEDPGSN